MGIQVIGDAENNLLTGTIENDTLDGGPGEDTLIGGRGSDTYYIDNINDLIIENPYEGTETVYSSTTYTLPDNVERLILTLLDDKDGYGNSSNNYINGNCFANYLDGQAGNDTIYGSWGNDTLNGGIGSDTLYGGPGDDSYYIDNSGDIITEYYGDGTDSAFTYISYTLPNNVENLTLLEGSINGIGNSLGNYITGNDNDNSLKGWGGNDTLDGGTGADYMYGGIGNDTYFVDNQDDTVFEYASQGNDSVFSSIFFILPSNIENLSLIGIDNLNGTGNEFNNYIIGNMGNNELIGGLGNDTLDGSAGNDILIGGSGVKTYIFNKDYGSDIIQNSTSSDIIVFGDGITTNDLELFNNSIDLNIGIKNSIDSLSIQNWFLDKLNSFVFNNGTILSALDIENIMQHQFGLPLNGSINNMIGTYQNDIFYVDHTEDTVLDYAIGGLDEIRSNISINLPDNIENLTLIGFDDINGTGNTINNYIIGNNGNNIITGASGNDTLDGGSGIDILIGGYGNDTFYIDNPEDIIIEYSYQGTDIVNTIVSYILPDYIEKLNLLGTDNTNGYGNTFSNTIYGNIGDNYIEGNSGNDTIYGSSGNDTIDGGVGIDKMYGGYGDDVYYIDNSSDVITEYSNQGIDEIRSSISFTLTSNKENLTLLGDSNLSGTGNGLNNMINGNNGNNYLSAGAGNDTIFGGEGNDTIDGSYGGDIISGGTGNDLLRGGGSEDTYNGYEIRGFGTDTIYDSSGTEDNIDLSSYGTSIPVITALDLDNNSKVDGLLINFGDNDSIQINNYFNNTSIDPHLSLAGYGLIETLQFDNGNYHFIDMQGLIV
jgi:Ca2+-binding RTX toxin-like protein